MTQPHPKFSRTLVLSAWVLVLLIVALIIGGNIWMFAAGQKNETLESWGSTAIGFIFGTLANMVKGFVTEGHEQ
jgi:hypothetical protein